MIPMDKKIAQYARDHSVRKHELLAKLEEETGKNPRGNWMTDPEETQLLVLLMEAIGAKRVLEIGTFTGYTTLAMALTVPINGEVITCDIDDSMPAVGRKYWKSAGVEKKISLRLGNAVDTMDSLLKEHGPDSFDFIYIDADKDNYDAYYERGLKLVRQNGLIGIDNVIWRGFVYDPTKNDADTVAIRAINKKVFEDQRVTCSMLTVGDGLMLVRKR
jgi:caffeoyl-CoA O-methyltransferase